MGRIAALGDARRIQVLALAGVDAFRSATDAEAVQAWEALPSDVAVLVLTPESAAALAHRLHERPGLLVTVLP